jgi:hypothetical protein
MIFPGTTKLAVDLHKRLSALGVPERSRHALMGVSKDHEHCCVRFINEGHILWVFKNDIGEPTMLLLPPGQSPSSMNFPHPLPI